MLVNSNHKITKLDYSAEVSKVMLVSAVGVLTEMLELVGAVLALTGRPSNEATTVVTLAAKCSYYDRPVCSTVVRTRMCLIHSVNKKL